jgi:hypothetical protein
MKRVPTVADLDRRLLVGGLTPIELRRIEADHDHTPAHGVCPHCKWTTESGQRGCPSWSTARAVRTGKVLPAWLGHLADQVPGARAPVTRDRATELAIERATEDALPGLFPAPARQNPHRRPESAA